MPPRPTAAGAAAATLSVADNAASATQTASLTGIGATANFTVAATPGTQTARAGSRVSYTFNVVAIAAIVASLPGCDGGFALPQAPTAAHTYTITISGTAGTLQHSATVQLTLQ